MLEPGLHCLGHPTTWTSIWHLPGCMLWLAGFGTEMLMMKQLSGYWKYTMMTKLTWSHCHCIIITSAKGSLEWRHLPNIFPPLEEGFELGRLATVDHSGDGFDDHVKEELGPNWWSSWELLPRPMLTTMCEPAGIYHYDFSDNDRMTQPCQSSYSLLPCDVCARLQPLGFYETLDNTIK